MVRAYSEDLRIRVIRSAEENGESARAAGRRFGVSESSAVKTGRPRGLKVEAHKEFLFAQMDGSHTTLDELQTALLEQCGMYASRTLLWRFVHEQGLSFKKNRTRQ